MSMEKRLMQKLLMTNHQLTDKMNNWCEINYEVNKTSYRDCKTREVNPVRQVLATWLLSDARLYLYWNRMNLPSHPYSNTRLYSSRKWMLRKYSPLWDKEKPWENSKVSKCSYVVSWGQRVLIQSFVSVLPWSCPACVRTHSELTCVLRWGRGGD